MHPAGWAVAGRICRFVPWCTDYRAATMDASHADPDIDRLLGEVVVQGGELDGTSSDTFIWVGCRCSDKAHTVAVRRTYQDPGYKDRKMQQIRDLPCLFGRPELT